MLTMLRDTAVRLMQGGQVPSVSDVAEAAGVSRATAYRYFPTQASIVQAAVNDALGPILEWTSDSTDVEGRIADLISFAYPRMNRLEATHRAALRLALDQWARRRAGTLGTEARIVRGNRRMLVSKAAKPLEAKISGQTFDKLAQSLSLVFGIEAIIVLRDIWGLNEKQAEGVALWAAHALVSKAMSEAAEKPRDIVRGANQKAATRPPKRERLTGQ